MISYIARRVAASVAVIYVVISISFYMIRLMPGNAVDFVTAQLQSQGGLSPAAIQAKISLIYGLQTNAPLWKQYLSYVGHAFEGNFGQSSTNPGVSVIHIIAGALPWTLFVVGVALLISFVIGILLGTFLAAKRDSKVAKAITVAVSVLAAFPNYLIALILLYVLADLHPIFPVGGAYSLGVPVGFNLSFIGSIFLHGFIPITAYVVTAVGSWALSMKGSVVTQLSSEYVRAAESWGLSSRRVLQSYVGRNSMLPQVTMLALSVGSMFGASVFIETFTSYPGIGYYLITSVDSRDYTVMMGCFILICVAVVLSNFVVDLLYPAVDPRITRPSGTRRGARGGAQGKVPVLGVEGGAPAMSKKSA
jgi:peptide/nickel transport system permease protein